MLGMQMLLIGDFINAISVSLVGFIGTLTGCSIGIILAKAFDEWIKPKITSAQADVIFSYI